MVTIVDNNKAHTVIVERRRTLTTVREVVKPIKVSSPGPQGTPGEDGTPGPSGAGQYPVIPFAYGDASSIVMALTSDGPSEITEVSLEIEEAFDGAGPALSLGTPAEPELLMTATSNDPALEAIFEVAPGVQLPAGQSIYLTIQPGAGATKGSGKIVITASPIT